MLYNQKTQKNIDQLLIELLDPDKTSESKIKEQLKTMNIEEFLTKIENLNFSQKIIQRSKALKEIIAFISERNDDQWIIK